LCQIDQIKSGINMVGPRAVILGVGLIVLQCLACTPQPVSSKIGSGGSPKRLATCTDTDFKGKVAYVADTNFVPQYKGQPPATTSPPPGGPNYATDLAAVFDAAPDFQQTLCNLDAVYILAQNCATPTDCLNQSWAWYQKFVTFGSGRLVGLSAGLWSEPSYSQYETDLMQSIIPLPGAYYSGANIDTPTMALLAALAHEVGHLRWYDYVQPNFPGGQPQLPCGDGNDYFVNSWQHPVHHPPSGHGGEWRDLYTPNNRHVHPPKDEHLNPPYISDIDNAIDWPIYYYNLAPSVVQLLGQGQPWVSALGAMTPDEDFVETYKFKVLLDAGLNSVTLTIPIPIPGSPATVKYLNIPADYLNTTQPVPRPELVRKVNCITL
jgi:hypothetical protein